MQEIIVLPFSQELKEIDTLKETGSQWWAELHTKSKYTGKSWAMGVNFRTAYFEPSFFDVFKKAIKTQE